MSKHTNLTGPYILPRVPSSGWTSKLYTSPQKESRGFPPRQSALWKRLNDSLSLHYHQREFHFSKTRERKASGQFHATQSTASRWGVAGLKRAWERPAFTTHGTENSVAWRPGAGGARGGRKPLDAAAGLRNSLARGCGRLWRDGGRLFRV